MKSCICPKITVKTKKKGLYCLKSCICREIMVKTRKKRAPLAKVKVQTNPRKKTDKRIAFLVTNLSLLALQLGGPGPPLATFLQQDTFSGTKNFISAWKKCLDKLKVKVKKESQRSKFQTNIRGSVYYTTYLSSVAGQRQPLTVIWLAHFSLRNCVGLLRAYRNLHLLRSFNNPMFCGFFRIFVHWICCFYYASK